MNKQAALTVTAGGGLAVDGLVSLAVDGLDSEHSRRAYGRAIADFVSWYDGQRRPKLAKAVIERYKRELTAAGLSPASVNQRMSAIRKLAREAADNGLLDARIAAGIEGVKGVKAERVPAGRNLTAGEIAAMFAACGKDRTAAGARDAAILALLRLGLRRAEVADLDAGAVDLAGETVRVLGKGNKQRDVPIPPGAVDALAAWIDARGGDPGPLLLEVNKGGRIVRGKGITAQAVYNVLGKRAAEAGVKDVTPHDWRRSLVGDLLDAGADLSTVQKLAGHASPTTTARYDRRPEEAKRRAVNLLHVPFCAG